MNIYSVKCQQNIVLLEIKTHKLSRADFLSYMHPTEAFVLVLNSLKKLFIFCINESHIDQSQSQSLCIITTCLAV